MIVLKTNVNSMRAWNEINGNILGLPARFIAASITLWSTIE